MGGIAPFPPREPSFRRGFLRSMIRAVEEEIRQGYYDQRPGDNTILDALERPSLARALRRSPVPPALILELKHASPGYQSDPLPDLSPELFVRLAQEGKVDALSVIPQPFRFGGTLEEFGRVARRTSLPVIFKDFIISASQIEAARAWGASAILLLARLEREGGLENSLSELVNVAHRQGLEALVEVHVPEDLPGALRSHPDVVGVNARDLDTLELRPDRAVQLLRLLRGLPVPLLGMSGVEGPVGVRRYEAAGATGILIGTSFAKALDRVSFLARLRQSPPSAGSS
jgi:indole-3-glycerol phosphate synthase